MRFLIISHALHKTEDTDVYSYAPYVREMNLWLKHVDNVTVIAPKIDDVPNAIDLAYKHSNLEHKTVPAIKFTGLLSILLSVLKSPYIMMVIFREILKADHIHLRCPGNLGLLGCLVQIFFPKKIKTAKYAGNWNPNAKQPLSYKFQKWILSNTFITKNIKVLVYGDWKDQTKNIKPFFTATYNESEIEEYTIRDYSTNLKFVFVGSLVVGKQPLLAIKIIEALYKQGKKVFLDIYGEGILKESLQGYIVANELENIIKLRGNQQKEIIKEALSTVHFSILPSKSEGWPKAIAEAMFFGVIPIATKVSCVPYMLDFGNRGILIEANLDDDIKIINNALTDIDKLKLMSKKAALWSQYYTLDTFENEIVKLLKHI